MMFCSGIHIGMHEYAKKILFQPFPLKCQVSKKKNGTKLTFKELGTNMAFKEDREKKMKF